MKRRTIEVVRALHAVNQHMPGIALGLLTDSLSPAKQHEFAGMLIDLGTVLHRHADSTDALPDRPDEGRHVPPS